MATVLHKTDWSMVPGDGASKTVTIPAASPGSKIIVTAGGAAIATAHITNAGGATFATRTTYGGGSHDVSVQDFTAVGGETTVYISLNGPAQICGHIYEVSGLGAYVAGSAQNNGGGVSADSTSSFRVTTSTFSTLAGGNGLLIAVFDANDTNTAQQWRHLQFGPFGRADHINHVDGSADSLFFTTGMADITAAGRYPANLSAGQYLATTQDYTGSRNFAAQVIYADSSGVPTVPVPTPIVKENTLPGDNNGSWYLGNSPVNEGTIAGFTDKTSYNPGDTVNFLVDSPNTFRVEIYRVGYYGIEANGARNPLGPATYVTGTPTAQPAPLVDGATGATSCTNWTANASWVIPSDAAPGLYSVLFRRTDAGNTGKFHLGQFIVKSTVTNKIAVVLPDFTWQAYNVWGATTDHGDRSGVYTGRSLYELGADAASDAIRRRAYAVTFDRPYATQSMRQSTYWLDTEQPWICFAEAQGYDLTYLSSRDLHENTSLLSDAKAVVLVGHHEYWSEEVYDCVTNAMDAGVNFLIQSSNTALWRVRFGAGDTGNRTMICYKDSMTVDVGAGFTGTGRDPGGYTGTWRDTRTGAAPNNPDVRRENAATGQMFAYNAGLTFPMIVDVADQDMPIWRNNAGVQALTTGQQWKTPLGIGLVPIGDEGDYPDGSGTEPTNMAKLSTVVFSSADTGSIATNDAGTIYSNAFPSRRMTFTLYRRDSGALIFNTGAWRGSHGISRYSKGSFNSSWVSGTELDLGWQNSWLAIMYDLGIVPTTLRPMLYIDLPVTDPAIGAPGPSRNDVARAYGLAVADQVDGVGSASFGLAAGGVGHVITKAVGAASAGYGAAADGHAIVGATGRATFVFSASGEGSITSTGPSRNITISVALAPGTPTRIHTSLGGRDWVGLEITADADISHDTLELSLGTWYHPGAWVTPSLDDHGQLKRTALMLVGDDPNPDPGRYRIWMRMPDSPEVEVLRYDGATIRID